MSVKRSRIVRSSSSGDTGGVINQLSSPPADSHELCWHVRTALAFSGALSPSWAPPLHPAAQRRSPPRPGILALSSPVAEDWSPERIGNFLERCFHCKKRIRESDEVFMYGHLRAFCTIDCREQEVAMDKLKEKRSTELNKLGKGHTAE